MSYDRLESFNAIAFQDVLNTLIRSPSVVGAEHAFFRVLQRELEERGAEVTWYEGVLVARGKNPGQLVTSAHIDRHGLICTGPSEFQYAAFIAGARSDLLGNSVSEELMQTIADRFDGVGLYAYEPWSGAYLGQGHIDGAYICEHRNNLIFEVKGLDHITAGTPIAFQDKLSIENGTYRAQLDNVLSAAVLVYLFEIGFEGTAFFTAQEEAGRSWRFLLEWFRRFGRETNQLLVLDTSPYPTLEAAGEQSLVLRRRDANASFNEELTLKLETLCHEMKISYSFKDEYIDRENARLSEQGLPLRSIGSTEMGRIIAASNGLVDGTTVQFPTTGYHTMNETVEVSSCSALIDMLRRLAQCEL